MVWEREGQHFFLPSFLGLDCSKRKGGKKIRGEVGVSGRVGGKVWRVDHDERGDRNDERLDKN